MDNKFFDCLAITGGIGSGKSTVLSLFKDAGYIVINADDIAHSILKKSSPYYLSYAKDLDKWLGTQFQYEPEISRLKLREKLNSTDNGYDIISKIALPYINNAMFDEYIKSLGKKIVFEVPLLLEHHMEKQFSHVLSVICDYSIKKDRIKLRNPDLSEKEIEHRIQIQSSDEEKILRSHYIINNSFDLNSLKIEFDRFITTFEINNKKKNPIF